MHTSLATVARLLCTIALCVLALPSPLGCAASNRLGMRITSLARSAEGTVQYEEIEGHHYLVTLYLGHLPPARRIQPGARVYVAWVRPMRDQTSARAASGEIKAGTLEFDQQRGQASLAFTTPLRNFELRVTAEPSSQVFEPSKHVIAHQGID